MPGFGDWLGRLPMIGPTLREHVAGVDFGFSGITDLISPYAGTLAQGALGVLLAVLSGLAEVLLAIFLAFFLYRDGPAIAQRGEAALARLAGDRTGHIVELIGGVTRGVVYGLLGTAVAQGIMTWFGLWISGDYPVGTSLRMGTGYVPRLLCWVLLGLGAIVMAQGLRQPAEIRQYGVQRS